MNPQKIKAFDKDLKLAAPDNSLEAFHHCHAHRPGATKSVDVIHIVSHDYGFRQVSDEEAICDLVKAYISIFEILPLLKTRKLCISCPSLGD